MIEKIELLVGIVGGLIGALAIIFAWRKNLLNIGFETFKETYRQEMSDFKSDVRGYINKNDEKHGQTLERIVELYQQTHREVTSQTNICKVIQAKREGVAKYEDDWKRQIEEELNEVKADVKHIREVINHESTNKKA